MARVDGREWNELRPLRIVRGFMKYPEGSVLVEAGDTRVVCTATIQEGVPPFLKGSGKGWITSEYGMLPRATPERNPREVSRGKQSGRTQEIQRLIGRALRAVIDLNALGERTIWLDCDVLQADGGTRTAAITGGFVALVEALHKIKETAGSELAWDKLPVKEFVAAVSVGVLDGGLALDLNYAEDSSAIVDMNVVMTSSGQLVEIQGTGEGGWFSREQLNSLLDLAWDGIQKIHSKQREALGKLADLVGS